MNSIIVQTIGFIALFFVLFSFQKNKRSKILAIMLIGLALFVIHFGLLGAWTGALMNLIETGVVFVAYKKETEPWAAKKFWPYLFIFIYSVVGFLVAKHLVDILPVIAQIFGTIAVWQTNPRTIRFIMLVPRPLWFFYNMIVGSYGGMATEVFILLSLVVGILRFDILSQKKIEKGV